MPAAEDVHLFHCAARENPSDERLVALAEVRDLTPVCDAAGRLTALPEPERVLAACLDGIRRVQTQRPPNRRLHGNLVLLYVWPSIEVPLDELQAVTRTLAPLTAGLGLEEVLIEARVPAPPDGELRNMAVGFSYQPGVGVTLPIAEPPTEPIPTSTNTPRRCCGRGAVGLVYPYELVPVLTGAGGTFTEYDLDDDGRLVPVDRPFGGNRAGIVVGVVRTITDRYPEGMVRVALSATRPRRWARSPSRSAVRILARARPRRGMKVPVEWFALSAGRQDRDGQRHREHGLDRARAAPARSSSPRPAARSTSSSPASTSAPSRTGTPRRRC